MKIDFIVYLPIHYPTKQSLNKKDDINIARQNCRKCTQTLVWRILILKMVLIKIQVKCGLTEAMLKTFVFSAEVPTNENVVILYLYIVVV